MLEANAAIFAAGMVLCAGCMAVACQSMRYAMGRVQDKKVVESTELIKAQP